MKKIYIRKSFQSKTAFRTGILMLASASVFSGAAYVFLNKDIKGGFPGALQTLKSMTSSLPVALGLSTAAALAFLTAGIILIGLLMSHRLAGPLWKVEKAALSVAEGNLSPSLALREKDEAKEFARQVNTMVNGLRDKVWDIREAYMQLEECARKLKETPSRADSQILSDVHLAACELVSRLDAIKTSN